MDEAGEAQGRATFAIEKCDFDIRGEVPRDEENIPIGANHGIDR